MAGFTNRGCGPTHRLGQVPPAAKPADAKGSAGAGPFDVVRETRRGGSYAAAGVAPWIELRSTQTLGPWVELSMTLRI